MQVTELAAGSLDDADFVGPRVVPVDRIPSIIVQIKSIRRYSVGVIVVAENGVNVRIPSAL